jgi:hypothetical protein
MASPRNSCVGHYRTRSNTEDGTVGDRRQDQATGAAADAAAMNTQPEIEHETPASTA